MGVHKSSVNFGNLIRDLSEMYPQDVSEVIVVELIANSLDAGANRIDISFNPSERVLVVEDNGRGMSISDFRQYHDFAAGLKTRGTGIGFAGVGAKISFNIADRVITETKGNKFSGGSDWHFHSKKELVWKDIGVTHLEGHGTRVEVQFQAGAKLVYSSTEELVDIIRRNYLPLLDVDFLGLYSKINLYQEGFRFRVNEQEIEPKNLIELYRLEKFRRFFPKKGAKRIGYGILGISPSEYPLGQNICGILLCTRGKVIKPELFSQFPSGLGPRILGVVEIPDFANYLTTSKTDFLRRGDLPPKNCASCN